MREDLLRLKVNPKDKEIIRLNEYLHLDESPLLVIKGLYISDMKYTGTLCFTNKRVIHIHKDMIIEKITQIVRADVSNININEDNILKEITIKFTARGKILVFVIQSVEDLIGLKEKIRSILYL